MSAQMNPLKSLIVAFTSIALSACQVIEEPSRPSPPPAQMCDLGLQSEIGKPINTISFPSVGNYRVIRPGDAVTKDYRTDRTNIHLDENDRIERVTCG